VRLIVNPSAGGGRAARILPGVEAALRGHGLPFRVDRTTSMDHARALARDALDAGELAVAMGGDGLTGAVAGELRGTDGVLGVLPGGRGNDFARKLGLGDDPVAACDVLAAGRETAVDVADANGTACLGIVSGGFDSDVNEYANATRLKLGTLVYLYGALRALSAWKPAAFEVTVDGERHEFSGYAVAIANSGMFGGGMKLVPHAELDDGLLDVVLEHDGPKREYVSCLRKVFSGTHVDSPLITFLRGREVTFSADRPFQAYADGDPVAPLPVTVKVQPGALKVLVP
jgi:YegS/Rv2252/BmrU family lipid kinase